MIIYTGEIVVPGPCRGHRVSVSLKGKLHFHGHPGGPPELSALDVLDELSGHAERPCMTVLRAFQRLQHRRYRHVETRIKRLPIMDRFKTMTCLVAYRNCSHSLVQRICWLEDAHIWREVTSEVGFDS